MIAKIKNISIVHMVLEARAWEEDCPSWDRFPRIRFGLWAGGCFFSWIRCLITSHRWADDEPFCGRCGVCYFHIEEDGR